MRLCVYTWTLIRGSIIRVGPKLPDRLAKSTFIDFDFDMCIRTFHEKLEHTTHLIDDSCCATASKAPPVPDPHREAGSRLRPHGDTYVKNGICAEERNLHCKPG